MRTIEGNQLDPRLYLDYGNGLSEERAFYLTFTDKDHWQAFLPLPCLIKSMRLDPSSGSGVIRPPEISVRQVDFSAFLDQLLSGEDAAQQMFTETALAIAKFVKQRRVKTLHSGSLAAGYSVSAFADAAAKTLNVSASINQAAYLGWIERYDTITQNDITDMAALLPGFKTKPLISVIMPVYNTKIELLKQAIESVLAQTYPYFELCIADDASSDPKIRTLIQVAARRDQRIKYLFRPANGHISECSNSALSLASGEFVAFVDHDDVIPVHSLWTVAFYINMYPDCQLVFSDEDKIDEDGLRQYPHFKGAFDEYLLYGYNMVTHLGVYRRSLVEEMGGLRKGYEGSQDYDLILRCFDKCGARQIVHIPHVLYHWRMTADSTSVSGDHKGYAIQAAKKSINGHFARRGLPFQSVDGRAPGITAIAMSDSNELMKQRVSIIIPTRDGGVSLMACVNSINKHKAKNIELIIVDNGSKDKQTVDYLRHMRGSGGAMVLPYDIEFNFSKINNFAAEHASGEVLCFLNDDTEVIASGWLSRARALLSIPAIGIVGARLLYANMTVQHFGVYLGIGFHKVAGHAHLGQDATAPGYVSKAIVMQQFCAVTGACLFIRREDFLKVRGFEP
ncbi:MAG: glycosyltransferase, partial [Anaerolineae bacterium]|nr:glycosyltransferase [Anaerolineae bacterium]